MHAKENLVFFNISPPQKSFTFLRIPRNPNVNFLAPPDHKEGANLLFPLNLPPFIHQPSPIQYPMN